MVKLSRKFLDEHNIKTARMKCIGVPAPHNRGNPKINVADFVIDSLEDLH